MSGAILGVIAPHPPIMVDVVGGPRSSVTRDSIDALHEAAALLERYDPDTVVLMSPHAPAASDAFVIETAGETLGSFSQFGAAHPVYVHRGDPELALRILERLESAGIPAIDRGRVRRLESGVLDHGALVPLAFLDPEGRWPVLEISLSWLPYAMHRELGRQIAAAAQDVGRRIAFVASGDCAHRLTPDAPAGYSPRAAEFDGELVRLLGASDFEGLMHIDPDLVEAAGECGLRSFITMGGVAEPATARVLAYEGPWGVGYLTAVVNEHAVPAATSGTGAKGGTPGSSEHEIVSLARATIESYVTRGETLASRQLTDPALPVRAGAFVSLHRAGDLRGCIGTIGPVQPTLAEEVVHNAIEAATRDPRFPPLQPDELADLEISVDVLHDPEPCSMDDLDPSCFGVIVSSGYRRGLLLPDLEGIDNAQMQVDIARRKGLIPPGEPVHLERFRVDRYT